MYPIFLECCIYINDSYWKHIFENLSCNICPYGVYISKNFLCCKIKNKDFNYKINENIEPKQLYEEIYNLLKKKLCLLSPNDKLQNKNTFNEILSYTNLTSWSSIRKKNIREILIENYALNMKNNYDLSILQTRKLVNTIFTCLTFKIINSKDIILQNGSITNINGIEFTNNKIIYKKDIYSIKQYFKPIILIDKKRIEDVWNKYIEYLKSFQI
jgi:hypothetical protein